FIKQYKMTCHSGGSMEIFIEPVVPNPHLIIFGRSYIARALARIGKAANFKVSVFGSEVSKELFPTADAIHDTFEMDSVPITKNSFIVVSTQGENDEIAVKNALLSKCNYVGFVASKKKCQEVMTYLLQDQVDKSLVDTLVTPVGLDIKAKTPDEVAISILAQIVKQFRESSEVSDIQDEEVFGTKEKDEEPDVIVNPVCNLPISRASSKYTIREGGHLLYFCCDGCKVSFDKNKEMYLQKMEK
ncbi:MAG: XdhC family protein, partial [Cyclobacteriaceae bacterium]|nr:XdhC family protein [Cyclobacteriaceae bacterium]